MKVKLVDGAKYWHWGKFSIRKGEEKDCPDDILQYADGMLVIVDKKKVKKVDTE